MNDISNIISNDKEVENVIVKSHSVIQGNETTD